MTEWQRGIEIFAAINFVVIGVSHMLRPIAWQEFFAVLEAKGEAGVLFVAMLALGMGSLIVAFHPGFDGFGPSLLTLYGCASILKGATYLVFPEVGAKSLRRAAEHGGRGLVGAGAALVALGSVVLVHPLL